MKLHNTQQGLWILGVLYIYYTFAGDSNALQERMPLSCMIIHVGFHDVLLVQSPYY